MVDFILLSVPSNEQICLMSRLPQRFLEENVTPLDVNMILPHRAVDRVKNDCRGQNEVWNGLNHEMCKSSSNFSILSSEIE